jgi:hypothetical protein
MPRLRTRAVPSQQPRLDSVQLFQIEFNLKSMMQLNETLVARITVCTVCHVDSTYRGDRTFGHSNVAAAAAAAHCHVTFTSRSLSGAAVPQPGHGSDSSARQ